MSIWSEEQCEKEKKKEKEQSENDFNKISRNESLMRTMFVETLIIVQFSFLL